MINNIIFDYDGTIISGEGIELLLQYPGKRDPFHWIDYAPRECAA